MKIAITGAHCVGKTSLAEQLHAASNGFLLVPEPYVVLEEKGHSFSETPDPEDFLLQLKHSIEDIYREEDNVIFDRCPLDLLAYLHVLSSGNLTPHYYDEVKAALEEIDLLVIVSIEAPDVIACAASEFPKLRAQVDALLQEWIDDFDVEIVRVSGTLSEREKQVIDAL